MTKDKNNIITGNYYNKKKTRNPIEKYLVNGFDSRIMTHINAIKPDSILEIGCGEGNNVELIKGFFPKCRYVATDIDNSLIEKARSRGADEVFLSSMDDYSLPYSDREFDLVLLIEVLEHVKEPQRMLEEAKRLSSRICIATVPHEPVWRILNMFRLKYISSLGNTPGHINHWNKNTFTTLLNRVFSKNSVFSQFPWLFSVLEK